MVDEKHLIQAKNPAIINLDEEPPSTSLEANERPTKEASPTSHKRKNKKKVRKKQA